MLWTIRRCGDLEGILCQFKQLGRTVYMSLGSLKHCSQSHIMSCNDNNKYMYVCLSKIHGFKYIYVCLSKLHGFKYLQNIWTLKSTLSNLLQVELVYICFLIVSMSKFNLFMPGDSSILNFGPNHLLIERVPQNFQNFGSIMDFCILKLQNILLACSPDNPESISLKWNERPMGSVNTPTSPAYIGHVQMCLQTCPNCTDSDQPAHMQSIT